MKIFTNALFENSKVVLYHNNFDFPVTPELGELTIVDGVLYVFTEIDSETIWHPLTRKIQQYKHVQSTSSLVWNVIHNLKSQDLLVGIYDSEGNINISSNIEFVSDNSINIVFSEATAGKAVIFAINDSYTVVPAAHTHNINDVSGLQTTLDGKASYVHTHTISQIIDLQTELDSKSDTDHTHNQYSLTTHNHDSVYSQLGHTHNSLGTGSENTSINSGTENNFTVTSQHLTISSTGDVSADGSLTIDSNTTLGTTSSNSLTVNSTATFNAPISFTESATLGNGNDTVTINCGTANGLIISSNNIDLDSSGNLTVYGNLNVQGTTTTLNTTNLDIEDNELLLNKNETGAGITAGTAGLRIERGTSSDAVFYFDEGDDSWYGGIDGGTLKKLGSSTISEVTGLQSALDGKASSNHTHSTLSVGTGLSGGSYDGSAASTFSVNFGTTAGTVCEGNDSRLAADRTRLITASTSDPSGGSDGDIWLKYTA